MISLLDRIITFVAVLILVGLGCLLLGVILGTINIPTVLAIAAFLTQWAWVIGIACALLAAVGGVSWRSVFHRNPPA